MNKLAKQFTANITTQISAQWNWSKGAKTELGGSKAYGNKLNCDRFQYDLKDVDGN